MDRWGNFLDGDEIEHGASDVGVEAGLGGASSLGESDDWMEDELNDASGDMGDGGCAVCGSVDHLICDGDGLNAE